MSEFTVAVIGTLDTKGPEFAYLLAELARFGLNTLMLDISCLENREDAERDFSCVGIAERGGSCFSDVVKLDKRAAGRVMVRGAVAIVEELHAAGKIDGLIALGGANGTLMSCEIMQVFPIGFPKVMVSVVAACDLRQSVGTKDIVLINCVTDLCLNQLTRQIFSNAAAALVGMLERGGAVAASGTKLQVGASMLGLTQGCVLGVSDQLGCDEAEVLIFHTNGIGGAALEELVSKERVDAVLDLTTNELGNNLVGGVFDAGSDRLEAAAAKGLPQVVAPGALDFVNFWGQNVPDRYRERKFIFHTVQNTLMRTNAEENWQLGRIFADKLNKGRGNTIVAVPLLGFSANDAVGGRQGSSIEGKPAGSWHDPEADRAFLDGLKSRANRAAIEVLEVEAHINAPAFIEAVAGAFRAVIPSGFGRARHQPAGRRRDL